MVLAEGVGGRLLAGGRTAALLGPWTLHVEDGLAELDAVVLERDEFLATRPLDAILDLGSQRWRFRGVTLGEGQRIGLGGRPEVIA